MSDIIGQALDRDWHHLEHAITSHHPHPRYHDHQQPQEGHPMSLTVTEVKNVLTDLGHQLEALDAPAVDKLAALAGNPVVDALLEAAHVPAGDLAPVVAMLQTLGQLVPKPAPADGEPQPA